MFYSLYIQHKEHCNTVPPLLFSDWRLSYNSSLFGFFFLPHLFTLTVWLSAYCIIGVAFLDICDLLYIIFSGLSCFQTCLFIFHLVVCSKVLFILLPFLTIPHLYLSFLSLFFHRAPDCVKLIFICNSFFLIVHVLFRYKHILQTQAVLQFVPEVTLVDVKIVLSWIHFYFYLFAVAISFVTLLLR